ncbi:unnamed protein product [Mytilus edulis]|uniref:Uncharacterized protein n=1 Tax=Mytilus edulis TaxID=6550 RepID=A0A8S3UZL1_MYTED|nr:unnamed protein product [Mytilus edulis]
MHNSKSVGRRSVKGYMHNSKTVGRRSVKDTCIIVRLWAEKISKGYMHNSKTVGEKISKGYMHNSKTLGREDQYRAAEVEITGNNSPGLWEEKLLNRSSCFWNVLLCLKSLIHLSNTVAKQYLFGPSGILMIYCELYDTVTDTQTGGRGPTGSYDITTKTCNYVHLNIF